MKARKAKKTKTQKNMDKDLYTEMVKMVPDISQALKLLEIGASNDFVDDQGWTALTPFFRFSEFSKY